MSSIIPTLLVIFCLPLVEGRDGDPVERLAFVTGPGDKPESVALNVQLTPSDLADAEQMDALQAAGYVAKGGVPVAAVPGALEGEGPGTFRRPDAPAEPTSAEV